MLLTHIKKHPDAKGFIIEGYPRTASQLEEFEKEVSHLQVLEVWYVLEGNSNSPGVHEKKLDEFYFFLNLM